MTAESKTGSWKALDIIIAILAVAMVAYQLLSTQYLLQTTTGHKNTHLGLALLLVYLTATKSARRLWPLMLLAALLSVASVGYVHIFQDGLQERVGFPTNIDMVIGLMLIVLVLEGTRRSFGPVLPLICSLAVAYAFLGHLIPGPLHSPDFSFGQIISRLSIGLDGIYGL
ncbi:MAG: C4-dicarboxylate ABC transporter, partial [Dehalococcoidia bacterium]|nr:C4-dicarboxylate ABC transporter [Dehalococcoidia bacterium]